MIKALKILKYSLLGIIIIFCTSSCSKISINNNKPNKDSPYTMPAQAYIALANNKNHHEKQELLLMAAGSYIEDSNLQQADLILKKIINPSETQFSEKNILLAKIKSHHNQYKASISQLSTIQNLIDLPIYYQKQYHELLSIAYANTNNFIDAINERIILSSLLSDKNSNIKNSRYLWLLLLKTPAVELATLEIEAINNVQLQGWVKLALIAKNYDLSILIAKLNSWQKQYPHHEANNILPNITSLFFIENANKIALLLPLTGSLSGPGNAIRDGFIAAYTAQNLITIDISVYDTNENDVANLYNKAINDGADFIVGPLSKDDVANIARLDHPIPTLLLNSNGTQDDNLYSFNLSPIIESGQIALRAHNNGLHNTLIIAPSNEWSHSIIQEFKKQWQTNHGVIVDTLLYDDNTNFNIAIRDFLKVSENQASSPQYHDQKFISSKRRQDFDMIFLLAYPSKAGQIIPMLRYYFANDVPIYAPSIIYSGNTNTLRDKDLDGVIFCDIPWVFGNQLENKNWPEQLNSYTRLYALGMTSYTIATKLNNLIIFPAIIDNNTQMILYMNKIHQVLIIPAWGIFHDGLIQLISIFI